VQGFLGRLRAWFPAAHDGLLSAGADGDHADGYLGEVFDEGDVVAGFLG
jgi:hypothetical protein